MPAFTCPQCGAISHHPEDVKLSYCGRCHAFMDEFKGFLGQFVGCSECGSSVLTKFPHDPEKPITCADHTLRSRAVTLDS